MPLLADGVRPRNVATLTSRGVPFLKLVGLPYNGLTPIEKVVSPLKNLRQLSFLELFGFLALILGVVIEGYALITRPGTVVSGDDMFGGAVVLALAVAFLHDRSLGLRLSLIALSTLGVGYFVFIHTQAWLWTILLAIAVAVFLIFCFGLRRDVRQNHTNWPQF
ncbi:hypothetical protein LZ22198_MCBDPFMK_01925 [Levilactobacillus zymae]